MVAMHYRWDFYGLSTDSKPDATNEKVANGSTYYEADTSKLYVWYNDQWYEKEAGGSYELPVASAETLGGIKVGDGLSITEAGVLSASGGQTSAFTELTSADYNYPADNPTEFALWLLPNGLYHIADDSATKRMTNSAYYTAGNTFIVTDLPYNATQKLLILFGDPESSGSTGSFGIQLVKVNSSTGALGYRQGVVMHE